MTAGSDPAYTAYAAANMTGANRLLIGLAWPLLVGLHWWRSRQRGIALQYENAVEIVFLALASAYAFIIVLKNSIGVFDFIVLGALFCFYLWRTSRAENEEEEEDEEPGPGAVIAQLSNLIRAPGPHCAVWLEPEAVIDAHCDCTIRRRRERGCAKREGKENRKENATGAIRSHRPDYVELPA